MKEKDSQQKLNFLNYKPLIDKFINKLLKTFGDNIRAIALFGSVARGKANKESDIDLIMLVSCKFKEKENELSKILVESHTWEETKKLENNNIFPSIVPIERTKEELKEDPLILLDVLDHGILLYDPFCELKELLDRLKEKLNKLGAKKIILPDGSWAWNLKPDSKPGEIVDIKL